MSSMAEVIIYGKDHCPYCDHAKNFFNEENISYIYYNTSKEPEKLDEMRTKTNGRTFPQIIINGHVVGGYSDLMKLHEADKLNELLNWWS